MPTAGRRPPSSPTGSASRTRTIRNYAAQANSGGVDRRVRTGGYRLDRAAWATRRTTPRRGTSPAVRTARVIRSLIDATDGLDVYETAAANHVSDSTFEADLGRVRARLDGTGLSLERHGSRITLDGTRDGASATAGRAVPRGVVARACSSSTRSARRSPRSATSARRSSRGSPTPATHRTSTGSTTCCCTPRSRSTAWRRTTRSRARRGGSGRRGARRDAAATSGPLADLLARLVTRALRHDGRSRRPGAPHPPARDTCRDAHDRDARRRMPRAGRSRLGCRSCAASSRARHPRTSSTSTTRTSSSGSRCTSTTSWRGRASASFSRNPLTASIKAAYPLIYELAVYIASELARTEGIVVNDDEIAYIAMHVGAYLDRRRSRGERVRVAVVRARLPRRAHGARRAHPGGGRRRRRGRRAGRRRGRSADLVVAVLEPRRARRAPRASWRRSRPRPTSSGSAPRSRASAGRAAGRGSRRRSRATSPPSCSCAGCAGLDRDGAIRMLGDRMIAAASSTAPTSRARSNASASRRRRSPSTSRCRTP